MSGLQLNLGPLKEPLGFIKVLQWIFSIFSFATCGGYSGKTSIQVQCPGGKNVTLEAGFGYPFRLNKASLGPPDEKECNVTWKDPYHLVGDFATSSQFYVTFAVFVFLFCMGALLVYVGYMHMYRGAAKLPMIDFIITVLVSFLWLVSTSAWGKALTDIKTSTGPYLLAGIAFCSSASRACQFKEVSSMGPLNVSVVIGFLNLILWGGNTWFVYKETHLHNPPAPTPNPGNPPPPSGM
ncbi:synaptophysin-like protein 1 [Tiliqua scincoides]|uniref:synaptophysin-like protein 1 n=1 Tax=Tiliqua scincoides TaxID=71010 RepID=UPI0034636DE9